MTTRHELDRSISAWLDAEAPDRAPDDVLEASRERLRTTKQRRAWLPAWRYSPLNNFAKLAAAAALVLVVGFVGYQLLPPNGGIGGQPTIAPSPTPAPLARGTFKAKGFSTTLDATGAGATVSGSLRVSTSATGVLAVDLQCERTIDGLLWIGGDITESTADMSAQKGTRAAIVFKPGTPVKAVFMFQFDDPRSASCLAFIDEMQALGEVDSALEPIEGTVQLAP